MFDHSELYNFVYEEMERQHVSLSVARLKKQALGLKEFDKYF